MDNNQQQPEQAAAERPQINLGGPFHPTVVQTPNGAQQFHGASMRDFFASQAPAEVPEWFQITDEIPLPPVPETMTADAALRASPGFDLIRHDVFAIRRAVDLVNHDGQASPEINALVKFARDLKKSSDMAREQAIDAVDAVMRENEGRRFFVWRWHYADQMLKARGY